MRIEGVDKIGKLWWVEADSDIEVRVCQLCGNPVAILNARPTQQVQKIRFMRPGEMPNPSLIKIGEFDLEVIREHFRNFPEPCPWCGYVEEGRKQNV